jgi:hypothetical protein
MSKRRKSIDKKDHVSKKVDETFLGESVPQVIKNGMPLIHKISVEGFNATLKESINFLSGKPTVELDASKEKLDEVRL